MPEQPATLLIVDDEAHVLKLLSLVLNNQGYRTLTASSGEQALAMVEQDPPDLILLDVMMPGMDGYQVASRLKSSKITANIPIIMLTSLSEHTAKLAGLETGAEEYLSKPVSTTELWLRVRNLLRLKAFGDYLKSRSLIIEEQLQQRTIDLERFRSAMDASDDSIFLINRTTMTLVEFNRTASLVMGYPPNELLQLSPAELSDASLEELEVLYDQLIAGKAPVEPVESRIRCKDGHHVPVEIHRQAYKTGADWIIVGIVRDITHRKEAEQRLLKMAHYDTLTGLPNRNLFYTTLQMGLTQAAINNWQLAVVTVDLDDFKMINETWGHLIGDQMLIELSQRLSHSLDVSDTLGRMNGDEFAMILMVREGQPSIIRMIDRVRDMLQKPYKLNGHEASMTASLGIALYPDDGDEAQNLVKHAHTAMHRAKQVGRNTYRFYTAQMNTELLERQEMETALRQAVQDEDFQLFYQPKIKLSDGSVCGLEALLRWPRPGLPNVSPAVFVPMLESLGLISRVGQWVITSVCKQISRWQHAGLPPLEVAVNVSGQQIIKGDLITDISNALKDSQIEPRWLELELTESSLMENTAHTIASLHRLRAIGVKISIDDFGTGYSSLAYLRKFPIDKLKIDIAFVREVTSNPQDAAITRTIIELAHSLNLQVIAEGIETKEQWALLTEQGCDHGQGYLFSKPLPLAELEVLLREQQWVERTAQKKG
ncbi:putative bifunctional diguanylate cyclase/phosphodiesterase [Pseudomonas huanghezhanensis]|uniref:putative bifunctional diguanylate cyclase/phosphodiesterase n=1 Tax=Pseudomonas huanghezhanensis TaxID=3002903 RepID=UPI0022866420|nr:EAL domain-containing protein [Pseudomonas sp. BSw22131]